jgi:hypothetical protein
MANYSYTQGMESRGLNWVFINVTQQTITFGVTNSNAKRLGDTLSGKTSFGGTGVPNTPGGDGTDILVLENNLISNGAGSYVQAMFIYDMNDPRRLPGDGIRFHNGGSFIAAKPL